MPIFQLNDQHRRAAPWWRPWPLHSGVNTRSHYGPTGGRSTQRCPLSTKSVKATARQRFSGLGRGWRIFFGMLTHEGTQMRVNRLVRLLTTTATTLIAATCLARAGAPTAPWVSYGEASESCATYVLALNRSAPDQEMTYLGERLSPDARVYAQWLAGYLTGINAASKPGPGQIVVPDVNAIALWVESFCKAHPDKSLYYAAGTFAHDHRAH